MTAITIMRDGDLMSVDVPDLTVDEVAARQATIAARLAAKRTKITTIAFFNRFTDLEKVAIYAAATADPVIGVGLTHGLAAGRVDLTSIEIKTWMDGLVGAGAITTDRETEILTP